MIGFDNKLNREANLLTAQLYQQQQNWLQESSQLRHDVKELATQNKTLLFTLVIGTAAGWNNDQPDHPSTDKPQSKTSPIATFMLLLDRLL